MAKVDTVTIPRPMYEDLEEKAIMLDKINIVLTDSGRVLGSYTLKAVITDPPTGSDANKVFAAVEHLINIAKLSGNQRTP